MSNTFIQSTFARLLVCLVPVFMMVNLMGCTRASGAAEKPQTAVLALVNGVTGWSANNRYLLNVNRAPLLALSDEGGVVEFLQLPDGRLLMFDVSSVEGSPIDIWRGNLHREGEQVSALTLSRSGERLAGSFQMDGFSVLLQADGVQGVLVVAEEHRGPHHPGEPVVPNDREEL